MKTTEQLRLVDNAFSAIARLQEPKDWYKAYGIFQDTAPVIRQEVSMDEDFVRAVNESRDSDAGIEAAQTALDTVVHLSEGEDSFLFHCSGYTAVANDTGLVAMHAAKVNLEKPMEPDVVALWHGPSYGNMAIVKSLAAFAASKNGEVNNFSEVLRGYDDVFHHGAATQQLDGTRAHVGSSGKLFLHRNPELIDVRSLLLRDHPLDKIASLAAHDVDKLAGFADLICSEQAAKAMVGLGREYITIQYLVDRAKRLAGRTSDVQLN